MTRQIELGLGDIIVTCNDKNIYVMKAVLGTPGKILLSFELQDDGTCKKNVMPAFNEDEEEEPFRIVITDDHGTKDDFTKREMLGYINYINDAEEYIKRYLQKLVIEDFDCLESCYGEDTREYYIDDDIEQALHDENCSEG